MIMTRTFISLGMNILNPSIIWTAMKIKIGMVSPPTNVSGWLIVLWPKSNISILETESRESHDR